MRPHNARDRRKVAGALLRPRGRETYFAEATPADPAITAFARATTSGDER
jgi:hypothetical protein